ncbi:MAG: hypothetical protein JKX78_08610 [Alteromonadaceae bacterium]|nr:hypothetical protein [Alteromonadaceae bacterium]
MKFNKITLLLCAVLGSATCNLAFADQKTAKQTDAASVKKLKQELQQLQQNYQDKITELESRLSDIEDNNDDTQENIEQLAIDVSQQGNKKAANTFNPGLWMILNGRFVSYNDKFNYALPGYNLSTDAGPGNQGLQLDESELNISTNVDDKFYAWTTISFGADGANIEEAYLQTLNMGNGFNVKFGRFFSNIGYLASKHTHTDDFANRPLPYEAFLGGQFGDDGIQTTWLAPTDVFWESGIELYRGDSFPAVGAGNSGIGTWTAFSHVGGDIGISQSWRAGLSYLHADVKDRQSSASDTFTGISKLWIADFIYRWAPNGNRVDNEFKLQGEYLARNEQGLFSDLNLTNSSIDHNQNGWYLEGVYHFSRLWSAGIRTSRLSSANLANKFAGSVLDDLNHSPIQHSLMVEWNNSEFSHVRFQMDNNNFNGKKENVFILQYIAAFGAHGAHAY